MITLEKKGPIAILTLNRPDAMNALGEPGDGEAEIVAMFENKAVA